MADLQNLEINQPIVNPDGTPTVYFMRLLKGNDGFLADLADRQIIAGTGLDGGGNLSADVTLNLENTPITPGSYTNVNVTVDQQGRITSIANGSSGASPEFIMATKNTSQDFAANTWTNTTFDTLVHNGISGASMTSGIITLPAGTYIVEGRAESIRSNEARLRLRNNTGAVTLCSGMGVWSGNATGTGVGAFGYPSLFGKFTLSVSSAVQVQQFIVSSSGAFNDNGALGDIGSLGFTAAVQEFKITKIA